MADVHAHHLYAHFAPHPAADVRTHHDGAADHDGGRLRVRTRRADENVYPGREITNIRLPARLQPAGLTSLLFNSLIANY